MKAHLSTRWFCVLILLTVACGVLAGEANPPAPVLSGPVRASNGQVQIQWPPYPAAQEFRLLSTPSLGAPFAPDAQGVISGYQWSGPASNAARFHRLEIVPLSSNALLTATVLNRLAYGPTPDELERILTGPGAIGPQGYIEEQLAAQSIVDPIDTAPADTNIFWVYVTATGTATATNFFLYLNGDGTVYVDDIKLVRGIDPEVGPNLLQGGDFEGNLTPPWILGTNMTGSVISSAVARSGGKSLQVVSSAAGSGTGSSLQQPFALSISSTQQLTLSFWYLPDPTAVSGRTMTARLSGNVLTTTVNLRAAGPPIAPVELLGRLAGATASLDDLRSWHLMHAVRSKAQLVEVLLTFWDNHFNTQYDKTKEWFDNNQANTITNQTERARQAVNMEYRELAKWRQVLLNPNGTFHDLLRISAESPAQMIYLDSVLSSKNTPNENYPRELLELFAMGSDNGYIQADINELSKAWTGVRVGKKAAVDEGNPFAPLVANPTNDVGVWTLNFSTNNHNTGTKRLFTNNLVHARFGPPYAGLSYALTLTNGVGTNGWRDLPQVLAHLANLPYTQEFISVKLCRLFVHEDFEFGEYDYTAPGLSPEAQLVKDCLTAWRTPGPDGRQGNLRQILRAIFDSEMFRGHGASQHKIKTPLEFAVSAIRALRAADGNNVFTADTDGYGITGTNNSTGPLNRMGGMTLFNRPEPDGYSEFGRLWLNTANLGERMRFCHHLLMSNGDSKKDDDYGASAIRNVSDPVKLLKLKLPAASWTNAPVVVDFFLGLLYPGEGLANLWHHRTAAIDFLNNNEASPPVSSPFNGLGHTSPVYDGRVRGMVALLMTFPRFQEQ